MNGEIQNWFETTLRNYPDIRGRVLEIGSLDICGSVRRWFTKDGDQKTPNERFPGYIGIDIVQGNGVDEVIPSHYIDSFVKLGSIDIVITTSQLEHDIDPFETVAMAYRILRPGGWLMLTVPSWRGEGPHDIHDYWRFMPEGVQLMVSEYFEIIELVDHAPSNDVMCLARKQK